MYYKLTIIKILLNFARFTIIKDRVNALEKVVYESICIKPFPSPLYIIDPKKKGGARMASFVPSSSRVVLRCQVGTSADGAPKLGSLSISRANPAMTADQLDAVAAAMGTLLDVPVVEVHKIDTDIVSD